MDFITSINNKFLSEIFPNGLSKKVLLGQLQLSLDDRVELHIHTGQEPQKEIAKWGKWGENYNTIVIKLTGQLLKKVEVHNWPKVDYCFLNFSHGDAGFNINFTGDSWLIDLHFMALTFQGCTVYTNFFDE